MLSHSLRLTARRAAGTRAFTALPGDRVGALRRLMKEKPIVRILEVRME